MRVLASITLLAILISGGCETQGTLSSSADDEDTTRVLAVVGKLNITEQMVDRELERIPLYQRATYESPEGKRLLVDHMVEQELLLTAARDLGLEEDPFVIDQVEAAMQQVEDARNWALIQVYYQQQVLNRVTVPEEAILDYYGQHSTDIYHQVEQIRISQIVVTSYVDTSVVRAALEGGTPFAEVASSLSVHHSTAANGGDMGWVTADSPIGNHPEISSTLFSATLGAALGPFQTEQGWLFFMITDRQEESTLPLEEVRERIENNLKPALVESYLSDELIPALMEEYGVTVNEDAFLPDENTDPDSLLQAAQNMIVASPESAIQYFNLFLERFPDDPRAQQTQFLIGFTLSEQLGDIERARMAFQKVIDDYPESDITDDAAWMIRNMGLPPEELIFNEDIGEPVQQPSETEAAPTT